MARTDNYSLLIRKLDQFIRKFYLNQMIRGLLYTLGLVLSLFLLISLLEYNFYFEPGPRRLLVYSFAGISLLALGFWVLRPLFLFFRLGRVISHEQAARIIGSHFSNVEDRLLNILQLKEQSRRQADNDLLLAGIDQKAAQIQLVPFKAAIDLGQNRRYARYALPPLLLLLILLFAAPSTIKDSTYRLLNSGQAFDRPAPFSFELVNDRLEVVQYNNFPLEVQISGDQLPEAVYVEVEGFPYRMRKLANDRFRYEFNNVQKNQRFRLVADPVSSREFTLEVLRKPNILGFNVSLDYPAYTGRKDEQLSNVGDLSVPLGTVIDWTFEADHTDTIWMFFSGKSEWVQTDRRTEQEFDIRRRALRSELYRLYISNKLLPKADSVSYSIGVVPDRYPLIQAEEFQDSTLRKVRFFAGEASDDYGLKNLSFNYQRTDDRGIEGPLQTVPLRNPGGKKVAFDHLFDLAALGLQPGEKVTYYFEVYDNDGVNGSKVARTQLMQYAMPTVEEFRAMAEENQEKIKDKLDDALKESRQIQDDLKDARDKLLQEKELDWQNRKDLEKLLERQQELQKQIQDARQSFEENLENQQEYTQPSEELLEKQQKLQELFEKAADEETLELMQKIQELLEELDKEQALEMLEEMQFNDEEMELELDRLLELYKKLEMEQQLQETRQQLEELSEQQEALSEDTRETEPKQQEAPSEEEQAEKEAAEEQEGAANQEEGEEQEGTPKQEKGEEQQEGQPEEEGAPKEQEGPQNTEEQPDSSAQQQPKSQEQLQQEQQEINEAFEQLMKQMEQIDQKNQELQSPQNMGEQQEQMEQIQEQLEQIPQQLQQQQNKKASDSQKKAAQQMQQLAQQMQAMMQSGQMQQMSEDLDALRQLLENLVGLSFDQEELMDEFSRTSLNTPRYVELIQDQFKLQDDFGLIEDSLQALAKRVFQIESFITEKVSEIKGNLRNSLEELEERRLSPAIEQQQRGMKNVNDLALMLSEVMNQMQQQMSTMMMGMQKQPQPGQSKGSQGQQPKDRISKGQQQLNEEMRKASEQMRQQREGGEGGSAREFAEMARRQAELRKALEEKQKQLRQSGQGDPKLQELIEQMDKIEKDLVNKKLTNELLQRQQDILSRLLDFEKAERQQEYEEKRKSETARQIPPTRPPALEEYLRKRKAEVEQYKTVSPNLKPYYKNLVEEYFKKLSDSTN